MRKGQLMDRRERIAGINPKRKCHNTGSRPAPNLCQAVVHLATQSHARKIAESRQSPAKAAQRFLSARRGGCVCQRRWRARTSPWNIMLAGADEIAHRLQA